jgi:Flp pilus assembly protein TadG
MGMRATWRHWARSFKRAESGVAAVEFALILPIMLMLYVGMVEGSALISMDRKVQTVSGAVGDLVARSNGTISIGTLDNYVKIASGIMTPYPTSDLVQIVTQVHVDTAGKATVDWSQRYVGQVRQSTGAHTKGAVYPLPAQVVAIAKGEYVIVTESGLAYTPLYGIIFDSAVNLYRENFFMPRFREPILLN